MKITKFSKSVNESLDVSKLYDIEEAFSMMMNFKREAFNESVDVAFNLGVDPRHADENIRLSINLPHGIGKEVSVLAIVNADKEERTCETITKENAKQFNVCSHFIMLLSMFNDVFNDDWEEKRYYCVFIAGSIMKALK